MRTLPIRFFAGVLARWRRAEKPAWRRRSICGSLIGVLLTGLPAVAKEAIYNVLDFGAMGDHKTLDTRAIQLAIDTCHERGGGTVVFPSGHEFLSGTLVLKNNVTLEIKEKATLRGSRNLDDYIRTVPNVESYAIINFSDYALIQAINAKNVGIRGNGVIDGDGVAVPGRIGYGHLKVRPYLLRFVRCNNVRVRGVTLKNPNFWTHHYLECDHVHVDGVVVRAMNLDPHQPNGDGIDIDGCQHVMVENMDIQSEDDGITLKSTSMRPMRDVRIRNNKIKSNTNAIKIGTETHGEIEDVVIRDNHVVFAGRSALSVLCVDGARIENITFEMIKIEETAVPIFVRLGDRGRGIRPYQVSVTTYNNAERIRTPADPKVGILRNITFRNIISKGVSVALPPKDMPRSVGSAFSGVNGHMIENLALENLDLTYAGGVRNRTKTSADVPERPAHYPTPEMFGELPAFAFYFRHVAGVRMNNINLRVLDPDLRSAVVFDNVRDVQLKDVFVPWVSEAAPVVKCCAGVDGSGIASRSLEKHGRHVIRGQIAPKRPVTP
jgi:polygalacturonase